MPFTEANGVNLYYQIASKRQLGKDIQSLVVLHGGPGVSDHSLYFDFWSRFSNQFQVVFFDMRGHGQSDRDDPKNWNLDQWGKDVFAFCDALDIKRPIVAGVSFGGWVALSYALQYPKHFSKLILCNTEAKIDNQAQIEVYTRKGGKVAGRVIKQIYEFPSPQLWSEYIKFCAPHMSNNPYKPSEIKNIRPNMELYEYFYESGQHRFDFLSHLQELTSHILILGGTDDPEHPLQSTITMKGALKNAKVRLEILEGGGDPVYRDFPNEVKKIIRNFITLK